MLHELSFVCCCPRCRRRSEQPVALLECPTVCSHCSNHFIARDRDAESEAENDPIRFWICFTDPPRRDIQPTDGLQGVTIKPR